VSPFGISVALLTPFTESGDIDLPRLAAHARDVMDKGAHGVTLFGTTGEGASISFKERGPALGALTGAGIPADRIFMGLCATSLGDVLAQIDQAIAGGVTTFLLLPPFYFPGPSDAGLFDWHAALFARADARARFILYHIPQVTAVPLSFDLVTGLRAAFPERVVAIKDSSGNWENGRRLLDHGGIPVMIGDERLLHRAVPLGAVGSICGMANLHPARMRALFDTAREDKALSHEVDVIVSCPFIPALKLIMAQTTGHAGWERVRSPLVALQDRQRADILGLLPEGR
jgi:4-hydroxy-tetrahydrodipicolinate synthase